MKMNAGLLVFLLTSSVSQTAARSTRIASPLERWNSPCSGEVTSTVSDVVTHSSDRPRSSFNEELLEAVDESTSNDRVTVQALKKIIKKMKSLRQHVVSVKTTYVSVNLTFEQNSHINNL